MNARERIVEQVEMSQMARNGVSNYRKIELPKKNIVRTENDRGVVESTKQSKIREEVPPEPEEGGGENGREIAKVLENTPIVKMKNSNRILNDTNRILENRNKIITGIYTKVPIIYYVVMVFGLASAIWGASSAAIYSSVIIGGIIVFLVGFIGFLEVIYKRGSLKITR